MHNDDLHGFYSSPETTGWSNDGREDKQGTWHVCRRREMHIGFWWENLHQRTTSTTYA